VRLSRAKLTPHQPSEPGIFAPGSGRRVGLLVVVGLGAGCWGANRVEAVTKARSFEAMFSAIGSGADG
jgi:hypothetical protein